MTREHIDDLKRAREELVGLRRDCAKTLAEVFQRGKTDEALKRIVEIQHAINAVDQALEEEHDRE